ncbi:MAG TPA: ATP-binding protein [Rhizomicrobium sp.]|jgi:signal transduction histidine kinase|nr:ATP-binding protein [Rhizomicrobium sp.]
MILTRTRFGLSILAALLTAGLLVAAGLLMARYEDQLYGAQQLKDITEQARILAASVAAAVTFDDRNAAQEYVEALAVNPELLAAGVYDSKGRRIAQFVRSGASLPEREFPGFSNGHLDVSVPVAQGGQVLGRVTVRASAEPAQRRLARYAGLVLLATMGALVIAVLSFSQVALTRRAEELARVNARLQLEMAERRKTEEALRQSHKMEAVGQLSGGIAHDFNNLIMIVKGNLRLLRKRFDTAGSGAETYIASAEEALNRAAHLTQRILAFSRRQPLSPKPVLLSELVAGMDELIRHSLGEKIEIETWLDAHWWTRCDVNQMENVILNLAINARDAMPKGGGLIIHTADRHVDKTPPGVIDFVPGDYVALSIRDTGQGMSQEVRERAVDPFFTTKPLGKGTGLGLSMTFGYVRQSSGYLVIESELGQGTTVTILMPRTEAPNV